MRGENSTSRDGKVMRYDQRSTNARRLTVVNDIFLDTCFGGTASRHLGEESTKLRALTPAERVLCNPRQKAQAERPQELLDLVGVLPSHHEIIPLHIEADMVQLYNPRVF